MNFPEKVMFRFIDKDTKEPVENVAAIIVLYAMRKNNYDVGPKFSNKNGEIYFVRQDCLEEIEVSQKLFIMDYFSKLEDCFPKITLKTLDIKSINFIASNFNTYEHFWKQHSFYNDEFIDRIKKTNNPLYKQTILDFEEGFLQKNIFIEVVLQKIQK